MSSQTGILDGTNIDISVFSYSQPKAHSSGGKVVNLHNKYVKESLTIACPLMPSWGAQEVLANGKGIGKDGKVEKIGTGKYTISLQFPTGDYITEDSTLFLEQMKIVEKKIKEDAMANSKEWFGKQITSMEVMDEKFTPMLKYQMMKDSAERDYTKSPSLSIKIPCWKDGQWQPSVFDENQKPLYIKGQTDNSVTPLDFLKNPSKAPMQVIFLIQCGGLWFVGNPAKVSITWNLKQAIVKKQKSSSISNDHCYLRIKPTEIETLKNQVEENQSQVYVDNSEDEADEPEKIEKIDSDTDEEPVEVAVQQQQQPLAIAVEPKPVTRKVVKRAK